MKAKTAPHIDRYMQSISQPPPPPPLFSHAPTDKLQEWIKTATPPQMAKLMEMGHAVPGEGSAE